MYYQAPSPYGQPYFPPTEVRYEHHGIDNDVKFPTAPKYRDLLWGILFILHLIGVVILSAFGTNKYQQSAEGNVVLVDVHSAEFIPVLKVSLICLGSAAIISILYLIAVRLFARQLIIGTIIFSLAIWAIFGIYLLAAGSLAGIFMLFMTALLAFFFYSWRSRIPFATAMLQTVSQRMQEYPGTSGAGYLMVVAHVGWNIFFFWTVSVSQYLTTNPNVTNLLVIFYILSYYWATQVIKNILHVTVSGTFATWYFLANSMPSNPTLMSFKRAVTTSFGSICLGSLLVAMLETMRTLLSMVRRQSDNACAWCADCILGFIEGLLKYFNMYAFTQVAIYGKTYVEAAKGTWELVHSHGIEAIINDNLVSSMLTVGSLLGGVICAIVGAVAGAALVADYWTTCTVIGFIIGYVLLSVVMEVVQSGVATIFVCFAMDREALRRSDPILYQKFVETYFA